MPELAREILRPGGIHFTTDTGRLIIVLKAERKGIGGCAPRNQDEQLRAATLKNYSEPPAPLSQSITSSI